MTRNNLTVALLAAAIALLGLWQLISTFGDPRLFFLRPYYMFEYTQDSRSHGQIPLTSPDEHDGALYLLGAGKADITGYANTVLPT